MNTSMNLHKNLVKYPSAFLNEKVYNSKDSLI